MRSFRRAMPARIARPLPIKPTVPDSGTVVLDDPQLEMAFVSSVTAPFLARRTACDGGGGGQGDADHRRIHVRDPFLMSPGMGDYTAIDPCTSPKAWTSIGLMGEALNVGFLRPFVSAVAFAPVTHAPHQKSTPAVTAGVGTPQISEY